MARVPHVKKARQRYETVPVLADDRTLLDRIRTQHALWGLRIADRGWDL